MPRNFIIPALAAVSAILVGTALATPDAVTTAPAKAPASASVPASPGPGEAVSCAVTRTRAGRGLVLQAVAEAAEPLSGDYRFAVTSHGSGGSSRSAQNGTFDLSPDRPATLSEVGIDADKSFEAELVLSWRGGEARCASED